MKQFIKITTNARTVSINETLNEMQLRTTLAGMKFSNEDIKIFFDNLEKGGDMEKYKMGRWTEDVMTLAKVHSKINWPEWWKERVRYQNIPALEIIEDPGEAEDRIGSHSYYVLLKEGDNR